MSNAFENINQNLFTGLTFLDLLKAFDTVSHRILLSKLDHYGIRGSANQLRFFFLIEDNTFRLMARTQI